MPEACVEKTAAMEDKDSQYRVHAQPVQVEPAWGIGFIYEHEESPVDLIEYILMIYPLI
jgi:hypothetical protein